MKLKSKHYTFSVCKSYKKDKESNKENKSVKVEFIQDNNYVPKLKLRKSKLKP